MPNTSILQHEYLSPLLLAAQPVLWWETVLGVVGFEAAPSLAQSTSSAAVPATASMTPWLSAAPHVCEVWRVAASPDDAQPMMSATRGRINYRYCRDFLFGFMRIDEHASAAVASSAALLNATESAYTELFELLEATGHRHLVRIWNYLPEINGEADGDERYRHFNAARKVAFRKSGRATVGSVPAACALGSPPGSPISIYFLAATRAPLTVENPRQTSAYLYPPKFGAHPPIFSRASVLPEGGGTDLFISGTASIVGHESLHVGDVRAQTRESLANIDALLTEANRMVGAPRYKLTRLKHKVYVRRPQDLEAIKAELKMTLDATTSIVYVQADVCREDLLVEIEATGESLGESAALGLQPVRRAL